ncbi:hypothetical protein Hanom_Chr13g01233701 [Helianthus anomalus]
MQQQLYHHRNLEQRLPVSFSLCNVIFPTHIYTIYYTVSPLLGDHVLHCTT